MNSTLKRIVQQIKLIPKSNPGDDLPVDLGTLLQLEILKSGVEFPEDDVIDAALAVGVPEGSLISWLEDMASWV